MLFASFLCAGSADLDADAAALRGHGVAARQLAETQQGTAPLPSSTMPTATTVLRGGTIVDGTGETPAYTGDVHVEGTTISAVFAYEDGAAPEVPRGATVIDCAGKLVTPGWVDQHTHYDGQVTWDPYLSPSSNAGVTTYLLRAPRNHHPHDHGSVPPAPEPAGRLVRQVQGHPAGGGAQRAGAHPRSLPAARAHILSAIRGAEATLCLGALD